MGRLFIGWLLWLVAALSLPAYAGQVGTVAVTSMGFGDSPAAAVQDAVINGVAQVNGESVAASMRMTERSKTAVSSDGAASREMSREVEERINRKTKGVVASWRILSQEKTDAGDYSAQVSVKVAVLKTSVQLKRMRLAVVLAGRGDASLSEALQEALARQITSSRKFALIDRRNTQAIQGQLSRIRAGEGGVINQVRLTAAAVPDYLAVVSVDQKQKTTNKSYAYGTLEVIDYSTRQVKFSARKTMVLDANKPATLPVRMDVLAKMLSRALIETVYPPTVVAANAKVLTIGQGKDFFSKGDQLVVYEQGPEIRDPHTGEYLSRERTELGAAVVTFVDARVSQAKILDRFVLSPRGVAEQTYVVTRTGENAEGPWGGGAGSSSRKAKKSSVSSLLDDED